MRILASLLLLVGCGTSGGGGEPQNGDVMINYGGAMPDLAVGSAVQDKSTAGNMVVQLGTGGVSCATYLPDAFPAGGTYVFFSVDKTQPTNGNVFVNVEHSSGSHIDIDSASGTVGVISIDTRVTGSIAFTTTSTSVGDIGIGGNFDVKRCF